MQSKISVTLLAAFTLFLYGCDDGGNTSEPESQAYVDGTVNTGQDDSDDAAAEIEVETTEEIVEDPAPPAADSVAEDGEEPTAEDAKPAHRVSNRDHNDECVYVELVRHGGFVIALGNFTRDLGPGSLIEPVALIKKGDESASESEVFFSLVSADGAEVVVEETAATFEEGEDSNTSFFADAKLQLPADATEANIRVRVVLPEPETEEGKVAAEEFDRNFSMDYKVALGG